MLILLPVYLRKLVSKMKVDKIPLNVNVAWIATAITTGVEKEVTILRATYSPEKNYQRQNLEMVIQVSTDTLDKVVEIITIVDIVLRVKAEGRIPRCFECGQRGHIKENFPPAL